MNKNFAVFCGTWKEHQTMNHDEMTKGACDKEWPDSLDAMIAAPDHHEVLLENERVRVLDSRIKAGETVPVHTHRWASVLYILGTSDFIRSEKFKYNTNVHIWRNFK